MRPRPCIPPWRPPATCHTLRPPPDVALAGLLQPSLCLHIHHQLCAPGKEAARPKAWPWKGKAQACLRLAVGWHGVVSRRMHWGAVLHSPCSRTAAGPAGRRPAACSCSPDSAGSPRLVLAGAGAGRRGEPLCGLAAHIHCGRQQGGRGRHSKARGPLRCRMWHYPAPIGLAIVSRALHCAAAALYASLAP